MWLPAQAWSCGDRQPLLVLTAQPRGQPLQTAGGLSQAEDQVPRGAGEMDRIPGDPPSPLQVSPRRTDKEAGALERRLECVTQIRSRVHGAQGLCPGKSRRWPRSCPGMLTDKIPTQTATQRPLSTAPALCQELSGHFMAHYLIGAPQQPCQVGISLPVNR